MKEAEFSDDWIEFIVVASRKYEENAENAEFIVISSRNGWIIGYIYVKSWCKSVKGPWNAHNCAWHGQNEDWIYCSPSSFRGEVSTDGP